MRKKELFYLLSLWCLSVILFVAGCTAQPSSEASDRGTQEDTESESADNSLPGSEESWPGGSQDEETGTSEQDPVFEGDVLRKVEYDHLKEEPAEEAFVRLTDMATLPDTHEYVAAAEEDSFDGSRFHLGRMGLDMDIPKGFYLTKQKGMYRDSDGTPIVLEFVDEYVLTVCPVSEEQLKDDIIRQSKKLRYQNPSYVVFSFRVFHKDYLPIECLFKSLLLEGDEYRINGDWIVTIGESLWTKWGGTDGGIWGSGFAWAYASDDWIKTHGEKDLISEEFPYPVGEVPSSAFPLESWVNSLKENTSGSGILCHDVWAKPSMEPLYTFWSTDPLFKRGTAARSAKLPDGYEGYATGEVIADPAASVANPHWCSRFSEAVKELSENPGEDPSRPPFAFADVFDFEGCVSSPDEESYESEMVSGWYVDEEADWELRAFVYANLVEARGEPVALSDIKIVLKDTESGLRLFYAYTAYEEGGARKIRGLEQGVDWLSVIDLPFAEAYARGWLSRVF